MNVLQELVRPQRAAVLVIDMQNDYVHRQGAVMRYFRGQDDQRDMGSPDEPTAGERIVPQLRVFLDACRRATVPLIWVRTVNDDCTRSPADVDRGKRFVQIDDAWGAAFYTGLEPGADEPVITKHRHSAFYGTALQLILRRQDTKTVILTGVSTPYCVESTARDAFARDYDVVTVIDCTASKVAREHEESLARLGRAFGRVSAATDIIESWRDS